MKKCCLLVILVGVRSLLPTVWSAEPPRIALTTLPDRSVRLSWDNTDGPYGVETATSLTLPIQWQGHPSNAIIQGTQASLTVRASEPARFFRLRKAQAPAALTTVSETSPANGESGVAVTRETMLRFSVPLATNTVLNTDRLFAEFAGRRFLSRVELSTDRKTATLFYLEPLPGSARVAVCLMGAQ